jgi:hypothetical protein
LCRASPRLGKKVKLLRGFEPSWESGKVSEGRNGWKEEIRGTKDQRPEPISNFSQQMTNRTTEQKLFCRKKKTEVVFCAGLRPA